MFGVSPAYFISRFGDRFTPRDIAASLPDLKAAGFDSFQTEVFHPDTIDDWRKGGARSIRAAADACGLSVTQFVGHFLLHAFETPQALMSDFGIDETAKALEGVALSPECRVFTVALPAFCPRDPADLTAAAHARFRGRLVEKLADMLDLVESSGRLMALELIPGNLLGGVPGFLRLHAELGRAALGYNFDTGFVWTTRAWVPLVPAELQGHIFGTHLKDNMQDGAALAPGQGSIPWAETLRALMATGYSGSLDIEFRCAPRTADREYAEALRFVAALAGSLDRPSPITPSGDGPCRRVP